MITCYITVILGRMKCILVKVKFDLLSILLDYLSISSIVLGKLTQRMWGFNTNPIHLSTQGGDSSTNNTSEVEIVMHELDARKVRCGISIWITHRAIIGTI